MIRFAGLAVPAVALTLASPAIAETWPGARWEVSSPESQGVDAGALAEAVDHIRQTRLPIHSLLIVRHGKIVLDAYFYPYDGRTPHDVASVTKSVTSMLTGIAIDRGAIPSAETPVPPLLKGYQPRTLDPLKSAITVGDLLSMTSGLQCGSTSGIETAETELAEMRRAPDWIDYALNLPMRGPAGRQFAYCSVNNHILSAIVTARTGESLQTFAEAYLFGPLGIHEGLWPKDRAGLNHGWADLHLTPEDMARLGYLYLRGGRWKDRQIVSEAWVRASTAPHITVRPGLGYGYGWWMDLTRDPRIPEAEGRGGQRISIVPDKDAVVVFTAGGADTDEIAPYLIRAIASEAPLPADAAADEALNRAVKAANTPPARRSVAAPPPMAGSISGSTYRLDANPLGLRALTLGFPSPGEGTFTLETEDESWMGGVGLDGVYRFSANGHQGLPMAARGEWVSPDTFRLEANLVENITDVVITARYVGERVELAVSDTTGSFRPFTVKGRRE